MIRITIPDANMSRLMVLLVVAAFAVAGCDVRDEASQTPARSTAPTRSTIPARSPIVQPQPTLVDPASDTGPPDCTVDDQITRFDAVSQWRKTLLDTALALSSDYHPDDLVPVSRAGVEGSGLIRRLVIADLRAMSEAVSEAGLSFDVRSAFRSYEYQRQTFERWVRQAGRTEALLVSARPGHSEHQLGTVLDFGTTGVAAYPWEHADWGRTPVGAWLVENSWQYGFILSYPKGRLRESCYAYEPWHYRYVGRDLASTIHESGLVPRHYFWINFESAP